MYLRLQVGTKISFIGRLYWSSKGDYGFEIFSGQHCERQKDACEILTPCHNKGECVSTPGSYKCYCGLGYSGSMCEISKFLFKDLQLGMDLGEKL